MTYDEVTLPLRAGELFVFCTDGIFEAANVEGKEYGAKRLCDVFDDELNRIAKEVGSRAKAFKLVKHDKKLVRFYLLL